MWCSGNFEGQSQGELECESGSGESRAGPQDQDQGQHCPTFLLSIPPASSDSMTFSVRSGNQHSVTAHLISAYNHPTSPIKLMLSTISLSTFRPFSFIKIQNNVFCLIYSFVPTFTYYPPPIRLVPHRNKLELIFFVTGGRALLCGVCA